jgi:hypothetical protein
MMDGPTASHPPTRASILNSQDCASDGKMQVRILPAHAAATPSPQGFSLLS